MPAADSCTAINDPCEPFSPESRTPGRPPEVSTTAFNPAAHPVRAKREHEPDDREQQRAGPRLKRCLGDAFEVVDRDHERPFTKRPSTGERCGPSRRSLGLGE